MKMTKKSLEAFTLRKHLPRSLRNRVKDEFDIRPTCTIYHILCGNIFLLFHVETIKSNYIDLK